jgi:hypothetical protein
MDQEARQQAIALYDRYTHEGMDRRLFMARMQYPEPVAHAVEGIEQRIVVQARQGEHAVDAVAQQAFDQRLRGRHDRGHPAIIRDSAVATDRASRI